MTQPMKKPTAAEIYIETVADLYNIAETERDSILRTYGIVENERQLVSAIFAYPETLETIASAVAAEMFVVPNHATIYKQMLESYIPDAPGGPEFDRGYLLSRLTVDQKEILIGIKKDYPDATAAYDYAAHLMDKIYRLALKRIAGPDNPDCAETADELLTYRESMRDVIYSSKISRLKTIVFNNALFDNPPPLAEPLIAGILRKGHKMIISGASKSGKSFLAIELAVAIAEGRKWIDTYQCTQGRVFYANFEIDGASFANRIVSVYKALHTRPTNNNLIYKDYRGCCLPLDQLASDIIKKTIENRCDAIILDPIYKVLTGDENNASDMAYFVGQMDKICTKTGAALIFVHHHAKGSSGGKESIDRFSGSGVFARDPDAIIDLSDLVPPSDVTNLDGIRALQLSGAVREFAPIKNLNLWYRHPIHTPDVEGLLSTAVLKGGKDDRRRDNLSKSSRRNPGIDRKAAFEEALEACGGVGKAHIEDMSEYMGVSEKTVRNYAEDFEYTIDRCIVTRK